MNAAGAVVSGLLEQSGPLQRGMVRTLPNNGTSGRAARRWGRDSCHSKMVAVAAEVKVMGRASAQRAGIWRDGGWYQDSSRKGVVLQQTWWICFY